jgi:hypothetical protein
LEPRPSAAPEMTIHPAETSDDGLFKGPAIDKDSRPLLAQAAAWAQGVVIDARPVASARRAADLVCGGS